MPRKPKPSPDDPEESKRFIEMAHEVGAEQPSPDFERVFSVYSTDDQQARYLLTPRFMEQLLLAWGLFSSVGNDMRACFVSNFLVIALPTWRDRFEPGAHPEPERIVDELLQLVSLAEELIDTLDLETRIWTRV